MELPICKTCKYGTILRKNKNRIEIDCKRNRNLGAVSIKYAKCPSYQRVSWLEEND